jgi:hypothetical protein
MTTSNHRPSSRKRAARKVSKKPAVKKPVAKKKPFPARASTKPTAKSAVRRNLLAKEALKFVDEAASVLRIGIREGVTRIDAFSVDATGPAHPP